MVRLPHTHTHTSEAVGARSEGAKRHKENDADNLTKRSNMERDQIKNSTLLCEKKAKEGKVREQCVCERVCTAVMVVPAPGVVVLEDLWGAPGVQQVIHLVLLPPGQTLTQDLSRFVHVEVSRSQEAQDVLVLRDLCVTQHRTHSFIPAPYYS